jgi:hypothetical protein
MKLTLLTTTTLIALAQAAVRDIYCDYGYNGVAGCSGARPYAYCVVLEQCVSKQGFSI